MLKQTDEQYDHSYWKNGIELWRWPISGECGRGARYKDHGPITDGQVGAVRKISTGRKQYRGMASDDLAKKRPTS